MCVPTVFGLITSWSAICPWVLPSARKPRISRSRGLSVLLAGSGAGSWPRDGRALERTGDPGDELGRIDGLHEVVVCPEEQSRRSVERRRALGRREDDRHRSVEPLDRAASAARSPLSPGSSTSTIASAGRAVVARAPAPTPRPAAHATSCFSGRSISSVRARAFRSWSTSQDDATVTHFPSPSPQLRATCHLCCSAQATSPATAALGWSHRPDYGDRLTRRPRRTFVRYLRETRWPGAARLRTRRRPGSEGLPPYARV